MVLLHRLLETNGQLLFSFFLESKINSKFSENLELTLLKERVHKSEKLLSIFFMHYTSNPIIVERVLEESEFFLNVDLLYEESDQVYLIFMQSKES